MPQDEEEFVIRAAEVMYAHKYQAEATAEAVVAALARAVGGD